MSDIGTKQFAEIWGVQQSTVAKWCKEGKIPGATQDRPHCPWHIPADATPPKNSKRRK